MNIKRLCKVAYIKQESSWASRYYLSILYWLYMPVYSSKKKPKQPKLVTLATWLCYLQTSKSNSQDTQTVGEVNLYHCRCIIWSAYFMAIFNLHFYAAFIWASWLCFQVLILDNYVHQLIERCLINLIFLFLNLKAYNANICIWYK